MTTTFATAPYAVIRVDCRYGSRKGAGSVNRRFISVLLFAFIIAGGASMVLYRLVIGRMGSSAPAPVTNPVLVATKNLELGTVISDADVRVAAWPGTPPQGSLTKPADVVGRGVAAAIYADEPLTESRLGLRGAGGGLAATIPSGMRAVAIRVNEVVGLAGFVVAGTHVDVLVSGISPGMAGAPGGNLARTLLQNIAVLSAGQDFKKDAEGKPVTVQVVNLLVTPVQAELLSLASTQMTIQLVLRNPLDTAVTTTPGVTLTNIFSGPAPPTVVRTPPAVRHLALTPPPAVVAVAVAAPPPAIMRIEIIQGNKRTEFQFQKKDDRP
jgi:pilus assembly protein CpaB